MWVLRIPWRCQRLSYYRQCLRYHSSEVRVRFAPSPTGQLHLGGLRTALYNYFFARSHNGKFILRIEDTDQTRLVPGAVENLVSSLNWAGISVDEGPVESGEYGPYIQSQRLHHYQDKIKQLLKTGHAYHCFCTQKRLDLLKKEALRHGETPRYDNRCRHLSPSEVEQNLAKTQSYTVRLKLEPFTEPWEDMVYGSITYDVSMNEGDPVLIKSDGFPTYHFANVVDDHMMEISHVLRGVEWKVSTPKHILLYRAFGWTPPKFAHLPLILNKDGSKLSKRQNDISMDYFKTSGYFHETLHSLLTVAGGAFTSNTAGESMEHLIKSFDLSKMNTVSTRLDMDRLPEFNRKHIQRQLADPELRVQLIDDARCLITKHLLNMSDHQLSYNKELLNDEYIGNLLDWAQDRIYLLSDIIGPNFLFLWQLPAESSFDDLPTISDDPEHIVKVTTDWLERQPEVLTVDELGPMFKELSKQHKWKYGAYMKLLRAAISGLKTAIWTKLMEPARDKSRQVTQPTPSNLSANQVPALTHIVYFYKNSSPREKGPSLAEMVCILGKHRSVERLQLAHEHLSKKHKQEETK